MRNRNSRISASGSSDGAAAGGANPVLAVQMKNEAFREVYNLTTAYSKIK